MTSVTEDQPGAPAEHQAGAEASLSFIRPVDAGLLVTLNSRMHCRAPMQLVDPDATPLYQPVHVDGARVIPVGAGSRAASVDTYRCACGFTIDVPAASLHALAS
ncbi:hypothetical protein [Arthrobacter sp. ZGTC412]|uniref:hypothetical protein n=1 Tax=Arthrobacter sp. ZGTC412 TaxID=2058900 RepID=UPI000CE31AC1|nr:hypothetical protein [Arthrobacter sp. ZGTC412]